MAFTIFGFKLSNIFTSIYRSISWIYFFHEIINCFLWINWEAIWAFIILKLMESLIFLIRVTVLSVKYLNSTLLSDFFGHRLKYQILTKSFEKNRNFMKKNLISHKNSGHVFWTNIDLSQRSKGTFFWWVCCYYVVVNKSFIPVLLSGKFSIKFITKIIAKYVFEKCQKLFKFYNLKLQ